VQLFGEAMYDVNQVRSDDVPFEEQLRGMENVIKAGKVLLRAPPIADHISSLVLPRICSNAAMSRLCLVCRPSSLEPLPRLGSRSLSRPVAGW
jgi:hypothetical protein